MEATRSLEGYANDKLTFYGGGGGGGGGTEGVERGGILVLSLTEWWIQSH